MAHEEVCPLLISAKKLVKPSVETVEESSGEHSYHGEYGHNNSHNAQGYILKRVPAENEEHDCCYDQQRCYERRECRHETFFVCLFHDFSGSGISVAKTLFERSVGIVWLKEYGTQSRRQGQCIDCRQTDRHSHSEAELAVEDT